MNDLLDNSRLIVVAFVVLLVKRFVQLPNLSTFATIYIYL